METARTPTMKLNPGVRKGALLLAAGLVIVLGAWLRIGAVQGTGVNNPFRADAGEYYETAYNLNAFGIYSHNVRLMDGHAVAPRPDALLTPGYPLFLTMFVDRPPEPRVFFEVGMWQALLAVISIALIMALFLRIANPWCAILAGLFTALSPHLVNTPVFMLSETLFGLLLLLLLLVFSAHLKHPRWTLPLMFVTGLLLGATALVRPVLEFFPLVLLPLLASGRPRREGARLGGVLLLGFALAWAPWIARNYVTLGKAGDSSVMVWTMVFGMYPDLEYNHDPSQPLSPNRQDPEFAQASASLGSALQAIGRRFAEAPGTELSWYLIGKPKALWSWDIAEGGHDAFAYHVYRSPYFTSPLFQLTHDYMYWLHWPLVLLALASSILVWLPAVGRLLEPGPLLLARCMSLLLFYNTAVMMILAPFVRYSIPFLPIQFGMAATALLLLYRYAGRRNPAAWLARAPGAGTG